MHEPLPRTFRGKGDCLAAVDTTYLAEDDIKAEEGEQPGTLAPCAAKIVMNYSWLVRMTRYDALRPICLLAREVTRWTRACDRKLHRVVCYLHHHKNMAQRCLVGDYIEDIHLLLRCRLGFR